MNPAPSIAVVGAGAVGCYFGGMLARAGLKVTLIGRPIHMDAIASHGLLLDTLQFQERVTVPTAVELSASSGAELVLFCVKSVDTESLAVTLKPHLAAGAVVISMQNGVDNAARIRSVAGIPAVPAVVYVAAAMAGPGHVKHSGRGDLIVGEAPDVATVAALFERASVPCRISTAIAQDLWQKMIMNCAYNAISALGRARYGRMIADAPTRDLLHAVVEEVVAVANGEGAGLAVAAMIEATDRLGDAMAGASSSTAQDIDRGRPTEIDSLNGYVVRSGRSQGIPTPINCTLWTLVKLLETRP